MAAITQSRHALSGRRYGSFAGKASLSWTDRGPWVLYTAANWQAVTAHFEVHLAASAGTVYARLRNKTDGPEVAGSELSSASATLTRLRSGAITLTDGKEYVGQTALGAGAAGTCNRPAIIGVPT